MLKFIQKRKDGRIAERITGLARELFKAEPIEEEEGYNRDIINFAEKQMWGRGASFYSLPCSYSAEKFREEIFRDDVKEVLRNSRERGLTDLSDEEIAALTLLRTSSYLGIDELLYSKEGPRKKHYIEKKVVPLASTLAKKQGKNPKKVYMQLRDNYARLFGDPSWRELREQEKKLYTELYGQPIQGDK